MAYFNHAFNKAFLVKEFTGLEFGKLGTTGNQLKTGQFGIVDPKTWNLYDPTNPVPTDCCNIILAGGSLYSNDKIGPFHGGYLESNKSKEINPKYVSRLYSVTANAPEAMVVNVGSTPYTVINAVENCCKEFLCEETYNLRIDIKGSPALRFLNHNAYLTVSAYTGCCPDGAITPVATNSTNVMIAWAQQIVDSPLINPFVLPVVVAEDLSLWYAPGTDTTGYVAPAGYTIGGTWNDYDQTTPHVDGACAGLVLNGAYVDTKFGNCTFQLTDFYEKEPVRIYVSEVDLNGDPCAFSGICVVTECQGLQANGLGETVLRELTLSEAYRQNFLHSDLRIREITQGDQIVAAVDRNLFYDRVYLQHNVPRFNNPTGVFDNDQYLLQLFALAGSGDDGIPDGTLNTQLSAIYLWLDTWLVNCGNACDSSGFGQEGEPCAALVPIAPVVIV